MTNVQVYPSCSVTVAAGTVLHPGAGERFLAVPDCAASAGVEGRGHLHTHGRWVNGLAVCGSLRQHPLALKTARGGSRAARGGQQAVRSSPPPGAFVACGAAAVCVKYAGHAVHHGQQRAVRLERERRNTSPVSWLVIVTVLPGLRPRPVLFHRSTVDGFVWQKPYRRG